MQVEPVLHGATQTPPYALQHQEVFVEQILHVRVGLLHSVGEIVM
jgi:hypothetical protein